MACRTSCPAAWEASSRLDKSTLLDAYKRNELLPERAWRLFRLSSIPIDRPEPAEVVAHHHRLVARLGAIAGGCCRPSSWTASARG